MGQQLEEDHIQLVKRSAETVTLITSNMPAHTHGHW